MVLCPCYFFITYYNKEFSCDACLILTQSEQEKKTFCKKSFTEHFYLPHKNEVRGYTVYYGVNGSVKPPSLPPSPPPSSLLGTRVQAAASKAAELKSKMASEGEYESVLCVKPDVNVYRIPPRASNRAVR